MPHAFKDARLRIRWAKESAANFERIAKRYFHQTACRRFVELDPDGIHESHKLKFDKPFPSSLTKNTICTVEHLRSALDLTAVTVAASSGLATDEVHFPFCKTSADFKSRINSACKGFPEEIKKLFASYEPYSGGSMLLFGLNELCNASKHRVLIRPVNKVAMTMRYLETSDTVTSPIRLTEGILDWNSEKNEITYAVTQRGLKWKHQLSVAFGICFGEVGVATGYEVKPNLDAMIGMVDRIVADTESMCRKLRLI